MATAGAYVFNRKGRKAYVGRGDTDVIARMRKSYRAGSYDLTVTVYETSCPREAYRLECRLFHRHSPCDNDRHPAVPPGTNWRCPVKDCGWA